MLDKGLLDRAPGSSSLSHLVETPEVFKDHLFILGGVIVETKLTEKGSQIEALFIPVNASGYLRDSSRHQGRFLAFYSRSKGMLDPLIYKKGREITLAGDFVEVRKGKIDEMEYAYPVFEIRQIYLWEEYQDYPYCAGPTIPTIIPTTLPTTTGPRSCTTRGGDPIQAPTGPASVVVIGLLTAGSSVLVKRFMLTPDKPEPQGQSRRKARRRVRSVLSESSSQGHNQALIQKY